MNNNHYSSVTTYSKIDKINVYTSEADIAIYQTAPISVDSIDATNIAKDYFNLEGTVTNENDIYQIFEDNELFQLYEKAVQYLQTIIDDGTGPYQDEAEVKLAALKSKSRR